MGMSGFRAPTTSRYAGVLFQTTLDDAIPQDHGVRLFDELLRSKVFAPTFRQMEAAYHLRDGRPPYLPIYLAALYVYGMMNRIRSSRQLELACHNRIDFMWLMDGQTPDHSSISNFVNKHRAFLKDLFRATVRLSVDVGLVKLGQLVVDGTKVEADASCESVRRRQTIESELAEIEQKAAAIEKEWAENERRESGLFGEETPWVGGKTKDKERAKRVVEARRAKLHAAIENIDRRQQEVAPGRKTAEIASTTDPEARVMPDKQDQIRPGYNTQIAVDVESGIIVAESTSDDPNDIGQLPLVVAQATENMGSAPKGVVADSGYNTGADLMVMEAKNVATYMPDAGERTPKSKDAIEALEVARAGGTLTEAQIALLMPKSRKLTKLAFSYDPQTDTYRCPRGAIMRCQRTSPDPQAGGISTRSQYVTTKEDCAGCVLASHCLSKGHRSRMITRDQYEEARERLRARMRTEEGRAIYYKRGPAVETKFAVQKHLLGVRRFMRRGLAKASTEWTLLCTALNFRALMRRWKSVRGALGAA
jgi:transposase